MRRFAILLATISYKTVYLSYVIHPVCEPVLYQEFMVLTYLNLKCMCILAYEFEKSALLVFVCIAM